MPQLDIYIISSQVVWLLIKFHLFYLIFIRTYLVSMIRLFKIRNKFFKQLISKEEQDRLQKEIYNHFYTLFYKV